MNSDCTANFLYTSVFPVYNYYVTSRTVNANDGAGPHTWNYNYTGYSTGTGALANYSPTYQTIVTDPLGNDAVHTMSDLGTVCVNVYETEVEKYSGSYTNDIALSKAVTSYGTTPDPYGLAINASGSVMNVVPLSITTTDVPSGLTLQTVKSYDVGILLPPTGLMSGPQQNAIYGDVIQQSEYDYGSGSPGALLRQTNTSYMALNGPNSSSYLANNLLDLPYTVQTLDGSGSQKHLQPTCTTSPDIWQTRGHSTGISLL
jgi:hypothetical protein